MSIDNKIWLDLVHAKKGDEYLVLYLCRQRDIRKYFKIVTIVFSAGGAMGWAIWKPIAGFACAVIALVQLLGSIESFLIHNEDQLESLSKLRLLYYDRANRLEELWHDLVKNKVTDEEASTVFFELRKSAKEIEDLDNKLNIKKVKKLDAEAQYKTKVYLDTYHFSN
ncbi:hypothetical protein FHW36_101605 [Chitinophaga polysaccharea]|uniref:SMODS and SLOG-associating 2TM effector domain-containing protein n=1 Tax=Chitinophaga polysaccharea TaxID=1293035 RepID=A0A561Q2V5_9BACT|nr:hypothetical protein [Chitinophaga polysaccharea]TWF44684.1 hypothetical protein FHW36_101605 [Chitinophaga polysaccharea]